MTALLVAFAIGSWLGYRFGRIDLKAWQIEEQARLDSACARGEHEPDMDHEDRCQNCGAA